MDGEDTEAVKTGKRLSWSIKRQLHMGLKAGASLKDKLETRVVAVVFFFFRRPRPGPGSAMVSAMAERHHRYLTEPECKGSVEQRLKEGTPVRQNRPGIEPGPPKTFPARTGQE